MLTRSKFFYLFEQNGKKSPELIEAEKKANIVFENICAHMLITRDAIMTTDDVNKGFAKVFSLSSRY